MRNYTNSDYALNKYSGGIVYHFTDKIEEITLEDYLAENPDMTEADFTALKELSDGIYLEQARSENTQTKNNAPFEELSKTTLCCTPSLEDMLISEINAIEEKSRREHLVALKNQVLGLLSDIQLRRYILRHVEHLKLRQIADKECVSLQVIHKSILAAEKKIIKFLKKTKKQGEKTGFSVH